MSELSWRDAIIKVLGASSQAMHYTEIAEAIAEQGLKTKTGATPAQSVNATISLSMKNEGESSPFVRTDVGRYRLRARAEEPNVPAGPAEEPPETGLVNAFGMFWSRASVSWKTKPKLLGKHPSSNVTVDFGTQDGVYLLHDRRDVVYVGRATDRSLGVRLSWHTRDRLSGRWERFSWFGVYPVTEAGELDHSAVGTYDLSALIVTMEALLIEGLEPPQNRKRGDGFKAVEFLQVEDPEIQRQQAVELIEQLKGKL